jgi:hypothetical protein
MIDMLKDFAQFWYRFFIGDDWTVAVGVVVALAATATLQHVNITAWCLTPGMVVALLAATTSRDGYGRRKTVRKTPRSEPATPN